MGHRTIIFDNERNCTELKSLLENSSFEVIMTAQDPTSLHSIYEIHLPHLVIIQFSGLAELNKLYSRHRNANIVVNLENHQAQQVEDAFNHGAKGYLTQPYERGKLIATLTAAMNIPNSKFHIKDSSCY
ncbi:response regulator [Piscirickettsia litoralis]|uniref:Response regulatory domain-containing protein n=1 Tax=Piscirickettsia litoralis TaxID=1891921 RepID=A0ABX3A4Q5_9GAMM|nr:response regulator [Piscirickettsia litoralis]ODN43832.1 hypothetical protein BGC07_14195 [Piscirickettsia litoralis]